MQFHLSTLFLIFFTVAIPLALLAPRGWGMAIWLDVVILAIALCLHGIGNPSTRHACVFFLVLFGIICPGLILPILESQGVPTRAICINNLKQIGLALHDYHDKYGHFPDASTHDDNGKPLLSWRVEILPTLEYGALYDMVKKDEPWNSPHNAKVLNQRLPELTCPVDNNENDLSTSYIAIIGPGTAWHEDGPVSLSDLPDSGSHTVMVVESVDSGVHWAEPRDLTVEQALEGMKTGKGLHVSSNHSSVINILFADGSVRSVPKKFLISTWEKILAGKVKDFDSIEEDADTSPSQLAHLESEDQPGNSFPTDVKKCLALLIFALWMLSIALLFRRAIKSRRRPEAAAQAPGVITGG